MLVALTDLLTRPGETGETCRDARYHHRCHALVRGSQRHAGDAEDARRTAHNPAGADSGYRHQFHPGSATDPGFLSLSGRGDLSEAVGDVSRRHIPTSTSLAAWLPSRGRRLASSRWRVLANGPERSGRPGAAITGAGSAAWPRLRLTAYIWAVHLPAGAFPHFRGPSAYVLLFQHGRHHACPTASGNPGASPATESKHS